ncbi:MAG: NBR1-Ig-like domain-containing protein [Chloroflexota bacterium]
MALNYQLLSPLTVPPESALEQGVAFSKIWLVQNTGSASWREARLVHLNGDLRPIVTPVHVGDVPQGEMIELAVGGLVPRHAGRFRSVWRIETASGPVLGDGLSIEVTTLPAGQPNGRMINYRTNEAEQSGDVPSGKSFTHTLLLENSGSRAWQAGDHLFYLGGELKPTVQRIDLPTISPGFSETVKIQLVPNPQFKEGIGIAYWQFRDGRHMPFGELVAPEARILAPADADFIPFEPSSWRRVIFDITSVFESGGNPAALQTDDSGIVSFGKHQATLQSGNLERVLRRYFALSSSQLSRQLEQAYLGRVVAKDARLRHDSRFHQQLKESAREPQMVTAQEDIFATKFYDPSVKMAEQLGLKTPLGLAALYDNRIQGGVHEVVKRTRRTMGGAPKDGIDEGRWLETQFNTRRDWLFEIADRKDRQGDHISATWLRRSVFRVDELQALLKAQNLHLRGRFKIRSTAIQGL